MIKVSVMYPNTPGARFDHDYYRDKHLPLLKARMGDACLYYTIDKAISGRTPDEPAPYVAMCHIFSESVEAFLGGFRSSCRGDRCGHCQLHRPDAGPADQ